MNKFSTANAEHQYAYTSILPLTAIGAKTSWRVINPGTAKYVNTAVTGENGIAHVEIAAPMGSAPHVTTVENILPSTTSFK